MSENKGKEKIITLIAGIILAVIAVVVVVVVVINSTEVTLSDSPSDSVSVSAAENLRRRALRIRFSTR